MRPKDDVINDRTPQAAAQVRPTHLKQPARAPGPRRPRLVVRVTAPLRHVTSQAQHRHQRPPPPPHVRLVAPRIAPRVALLRLPAQNVPHLRRRRPPRRRVVDIQVPRPA
jgi:hypothetical protein